MDRHTVSIVGAELRDSVLIEKGSRIEEDPKRERKYITVEKFTSFDGIEIAYYTWGEVGALPPVVLHHGFIANADLNWVQPGVVRALVTAGRQVVALDARGHGASAKPHDPDFYGEGKMAQDLSRLFDIIGGEQFDLAGYSMGAIVSLIAASQDARIRRLVVGGVGGRIAGRDESEARSPTGDPSFVAAMQAQDTSTITNPIAKAFRSFADRVGSDREALAAQLIARHKGVIPLSQISAPTLLITGDSDPLATEPEKLAAAIPNVQTLLLPGDHLGIVRLPRFTNALVEFLSQ